MLPPSMTGLLCQQRRGRPLTRGDVADKVFSSTREDHSSFFDLSERYEEFCVMFNANDPYVFPNLQPAPQGGGAGDPNLFAPPAQQQQPQQHQQQQPQQQPGGGMPGAVFQAIPGLGAQGLAANLAAGNAGGGVPSSVAR